MVTSTNITIISLFIGLVFVYKWNIAYHLRRLFNIDKEKPFKPFDCLPCFSAWTAAIISVVAFRDVVFTIDQAIQFVVPTAATFIAAYLIDK